MLTQTRPLLRSRFVVVCTGSADLSRRRSSPLSQRLSTPHALNTDRHRAAMCRDGGVGEEEEAEERGAQGGCFNLAYPPTTAPPPRRTSPRGRGSWVSELRDSTGADDERLCSSDSFLPSCPWLRTCSAAEKSAPSPTLHYDKSRQAGRQAARQAGSCAISTS